LERPLLNHMAMFKRLGRLFVIKTRWEAWAVIWAITLGGVERGKHYLEIYPGITGWLFFAACSAVVFLAGPKLLDSVRPAEIKKPEPIRVATRHQVSRSRPSSSRRPGGSASRPSLRKG
jgi:hypothetical protein